MPLYLSESLVGEGTPRDPLVPRGSGEPGWSVLYLGATNKSLLWLPSPSLDASLTLLALDKADTPGLATRNTLATKLNLTLTLQKASDLVAEIMLTPAKGWNTLQPRQDGTLEIWLANTLWHQQVTVKGAASDSSPFNTPDETPLAEGSRWTGGPGGWSDMQKVSGRARCGVINQDDAVYLATPSIGNDQFSQATVYGPVAGEYPGLILRGSGSVCYDCQCQITSTIRIYKSDSGFAFTEIGSGAGSVASGSVMYAEINGSTITVKDDGSTVRTETDTTITSGQPGMSGYAQGDISYCELDDWSGGDLGGGAATVIKDMLGLDWIPKKR